MEEILSACGLVCNTCNFFNQGCQGCIAVKGATFWAKEMLPEGVCPMYKCSVIGHGYVNCGDCKDLPCKMFYDMKDPNTTIDEHNKSIYDRVKRLKGELNGN